MTDKEKVKAYDEALERARKMLNMILDNELLGFPDQIREIFPQLRESEDERIRKEIVSALKFANVGGIYDKHITYLEKQKPVECIDFYDEFYKVYTGPKNILAYANMFVKKLGYIPIDIHELSACVYYVIKHIEEDTKASQKEQKPVDYDAELKKCEDNPLYFFDKYVSIKQKSTRWSYPYGRNETVDMLVSLAECLEMDGNCLFNEHTGKEYGKFLRDLARKQVECKSEKWNDSVTKEMFIKALERAVDQTKKGYELTDCDKHSWWEDFKLYSEIKLIEIEWSAEDSVHLTNAILSAEKEWGSESYTANWLRSLPERFNLQPKKEQSKYDGNMDKECIKLCNTLNSIPSVNTFESCCGHLKDRYSVWFFCNDTIAISRLGRSVDRNYSDGKWELVVDTTDTHPTGVFWLRSKVPFQSYDEMEESVNELCVSIQYWFSTKFDSYFNDRQRL